jgi:redox-sensitive bicupin YhaK (pirin superfamily)
VDPYILVHEAEVRIDPNQPARDTTHPHRGFGNLWYAITGSSSTGHSTGPGTRFMLMAGKPYGEAPVYNGPYVD